MSELSTVGVGLASYLAGRLNEGLPAGSAAAVSSALDAAMKVIDTDGDTSFLDRSLTAVTNLEARLTILKALHVFRPGETYLEEILSLKEELLATSLSRKLPELSGMARYNEMSSFNWEPMCGPGLGPEDDDE